MKQNVAVICGGTSCEHEISLLSAKNVMQALLDSEKYTIVPIYIAKDGSWHHFEKERLLSQTVKELLTTKTHDFALQVSDTKHPVLPKQAIDVVFPVVHGPYGEDGTVQGFLKLARVPFVGASVLGSSVAMDKDVAKRLLRERGIPVVDFVTINGKNRKEYDPNAIIEKLGLPLFVKAANLGSSVGVYKVHSAKELSESIEKAFIYDTKVLVEKAVKCRELECAVLGNNDPKASIIGEVKTTHEFYDYAAKYLEDDAYELVVPAHITSEQEKMCQQMALDAFDALNLTSMARVDFFLDETGALFVNEVNTIPGFTNISMYPKLWQASGLSYITLVETLVELAIEKHQEERMLANTLL